MFHIILYKNLQALHKNLNHQWIPTAATIQCIDYLYQLWYIETIDNCQNWQVNKDGIKKINLQHIEFLTEWAAVINDLILEKGESLRAVLDLMRWETDFWSKIGGTRWAVYGSGFTRGRHRRFRPRFMITRTSF